MPVNLFEAIEPSVSALLGGARVDLMRQSAKHQPVITDSTLVLPISIDEHDFQFVAERPGLLFTKSEQQFMRELLTAFAGLYTGFKLEGYAAHFRTRIRHIREHALFMRSIAFYRIDQIRHQICPALILIEHFSPTRFRFFIQRLKSVVATAAQIQQQ